MILGITGGICTGKTTAANVLVTKGVKVVDCDEISRYLSTYDTKVQSAVREHFGDSVFFEHGALNRAALANVVFSDKKERTALERILHPSIITCVQANIKLCEKLSKHLVVVAPLLIEAGMTNMVDTLWVVTCSAEEQISRLCKRSGTPKNEAILWIEAQMELSQKEKYANSVISNEGGIEEFRNHVSEQWEQFLEPC